MSIGISGYAEEEDDQKEIMSGSYPDIARTGPNSYRIMMTSMDITRRAGPPSQHSHGRHPLLCHHTSSNRIRDLLSGASDNRSGLVNGSIDLQNHDIRNAVNLSAWYPGFSTWDPTSRDDAGNTPVLPCTQLGWGVVNMSNIEPIIEHLNGTATLPQRPADVTASHADESSDPGSVLGRVNDGSSGPFDQRESKWRGAETSCSIDAIDGLRCRGDRQNDLKHHGGPSRAVSLFSSELIEALQEEGHPIQPGSTGENLTLRGVMWQDMAPGVRLRIGTAHLEITAPLPPVESFERVSRQGASPGSQSEPILAGPVGTPRFSLKGP